MNSTNSQAKRKNISDKDIQDFFFFVEEKLESNRDKLDKFVDVVQEFNTQNDEETIQKLKDIFSSCPILIYELNKLLPKSNRLPLVDQENADSFLQKIRNRDEGTFKEVMKAILALKSGEMTQEKIVIKFEELLTRYPDLLEEAYLFADYKKINSSNFKKTISAKLPQATRPDLKKPNTTSSITNEKNVIKYLENVPIAPKIQTSPDFVFFSSLKELFSPSTYKVIIKLLHLYNEGVLSHYEFIELAKPYFARQNHLFDYLTTLTYSKMMNRRQYAIFNRPICELDLSKSLRVASYYDLPTEFPHRVSSNRNEFESSILNNRLVTIPTGSEDDKNPMKKNHYEENLFKCEDQRYEIDMKLEIFNFAVEGLESLLQRVTEQNLASITEDFLSRELGKSNYKFIVRLYRDFGHKIIQGLLQNPKKSIPIIINYLKKEIEEKVNQRTETEKSIKVSFDRFYNKSFDYRSFKFKNFDKKNNNAKAFLKEIINRKKDKQTTSNVNVLKGGTDNSEFFTSLNLKFHKENVIKQTDDRASASILLNDIDLDAMRKQLPELKIIFDNLDILYLTIALIYYQLFTMNNIDLDKICEYFNPLILNLFGMNLSGLIENLKSNSVYNDRNLNYSEIVDAIKNKTPIEEKDYVKYYNLDSLAKTIILVNDNGIGANGTKNDKANWEENVEMSPISLTPSLQSQDTGKTFKDIITFNSNNKTDNNSNTNKADAITSLFYPLSEDNILFYANENCFIFLRYIFCIYERLNKLNEYNSSNSNNNNNNGNTNQSQEPNSTPAEFKNFIIIYKALLHKKIENTTMYEELCRDILGNESYFLFNVDKLINSLSKTMTTIINDQLSKEVINLFEFEINRKTSPNEKLYLANYLQMLDNNSGNNFRILINRDLWIMCIHLMELPIEPNKKDYYDQFKEFVDKTLQASYISMYQDNQSDDDPFNIFLNRNKAKVLSKRECLKPLLCSNNLVFRFDYATKKLQYLKSGCDVLMHSKPIRSKVDRAKKIIEKNITFTNWNDIKLTSLH